MYGYLHPHLAASESEPADLVAKKGWFDNIGKLAGTVHHLHGLFGRDFAESLMKRGENKDTTDFFVHIDIKITAGNRQ